MLKDVKFQTHAWYTCTNRRGGMQSGQRELSSRFELLTGYRTLSTRPLEEHSEVATILVVDRFVPLDGGVPVFRCHTYQTCQATATGHDICAYCGTDNGAPGESARQGWDCYQCGGN
jgi:hypothetical protein